MEVETLNNRQLITPEVTNLHIIILNAFQLLITKVITNSENALTNKLKLINLCVSIFKSKPVAQTFLYFCEKKAATSLVIRRQIPLEYHEAWKSLRRLEALGFIHRVQPVHRIEKVRGGPRYKLYAVEGCTDEEIAMAIQLHGRCRSPKYLMAEEVAQSILFDYIDRKGLKEITYRQLITEIKRRGKPYIASDIAQISIPILRENGVKVWR